MIVAWLAAKFGPQWLMKLAPWVIIALLILGLLTVSHCSKRGAEQAVKAQAEQGNRSGVAIADAASHAVETVEARSDADKTIDAATAVAQEEIGNAQDPAEVRAAVVRAVCMQHSHRNDPACVVRKARP